jgi:hypothetical protein
MPLRDLHEHSEVVEPEDNGGSPVAGDAWGDFERTYAQTTISCYLSVSRFLIRMHRLGIRDKENMARNLILNHTDAFAAVEGMKNVTAPVMAAVAAAWIGYQDAGVRQRLDFLVNSYGCGGKEKANRASFKLEKVLKEVPQGQWRGDRVRVWAFHVTESAIEAFVAREPNFVVPSKHDNHPLLVKVPGVSE